MCVCAKPFAIPRRRIPFPQFSLGGVQWGKHHPHLHEFNDDRLPLPVRSTMLASRQSLVIDPKTANANGQWNGHRGCAVHSAMRAYPMSRSCTPQHPQRTYAGLPMPQLKPVVRRHREPTSRSVTPLLPHRKQHLQAFGRQSVAFSLETGTHIMRRTTPMSLKLPMNRQSD